MALKAQEQEHLLSSGNLTLEALTAVRVHFRGAPVCILPSHERGVWLWAPGTGLPFHAAGSEQFCEIHCEPTSRPG